MYDNLNTTQTSQTAPGAAHTRILLQCYHAWTLLYCDLLHLLLRSKYATASSNTGPVPVPVPGGGTGTGAGTPVPVPGAGTGVNVG